jgi:hypothetical protein
MTPLSFAAPGLLADHTDLTPGDAGKEDNQRAALTGTSEATAEG